MPPLTPITQREQLPAQDRAAFDAIIASRAGVSAETIEAIRTRGDISALSRRAQIIVRIGRELVGGHQLSAELFEAGRSELGERGIIEVLAAMGYYLMIGCVLIATDMELPQGGERLPR